MSLPATAVLDFHGPAALWSGDRSRGFFNGAAAALLGLGESDGNAGDLWLRRVHPQERHRVTAAWRSLQRRPASMVCSYRFTPAGGEGTVELRETSRCLPAAVPGETLVLSYFEIVEGRARRLCGDGLRDWIHQVGNHLQSIRSEADLSRLSGALPQESFDTIARGVDAIHRLTAQLDTADLAESALGERRQAAVPAAAAPGNSRADEV